MNVPEVFCCTCIVCHVELLICLLFLTPLCVFVLLFCVFYILITLTEAALLADVSLCDKNIEFMNVIAYTYCCTVVIRQSWWRMKIRTVHSWTKILI